MNIPQRVEYFPQRIDHAHLRPPIRDDWKSPDELAWNQALLDGPNSASPLLQELRILDLPRPFATPPGVILPPVDEFGWPMGEDYAAILEARTPSLSTRATMRGIKFHRRYEALSMGELGIQVALMFNPYVIDFREQYGIYDERNYWKAKRQGKRMLRSHVMTIDIIVTYVLPHSKQLRYHGISVKHESYVASPSDLRREERERDAMAKRGWTWELMLSNAVPRMEIENYFLLRQMIRDTDVREWYGRAQDFAKVLLASSARASMASVLARLARRHGISCADAHRLFAVAVAYGFLTLDHTKRLAPELPIALIR
ncbi:TnsA endonuclease N-terminal domain-containing protein (plasmid) [Paraburkholderia strydomiana]